jgi:hypothetical protein
VGEDVKTREQWAALFLKAESVDAHSMVGLYQAFAITRARILIFSRMYLRPLQKVALSFQAIQKSSPIRKMKKHKETADLSLEPAVDMPYDKDCFGNYSGVVQTTRDLFANCLKANLWPILGEPPADVAQAPKDSSRLSFEVLSTPKKLAMYTYLQSAVLTPVRKPPRRLHNGWLSLKSSVAQSSSPT